MRFLIAILMSALSFSVFAAEQATLRNLIRNAGFTEMEPENPEVPSFWQTQVRVDQNKHRPEVQFSIFPAENGRGNAVRIVVPPPGKKGKSAALYLQLIKVKPNTNYYASCYRKVRMGWAPVFLDLRDGKRKLIRAFGLEQTENNGREKFNLCEKSFRTGPDIHYCQFMLTIQNLGFGEVEFYEPVLIELPD